MPDDDATTLHHADAPDAYRWRRSRAYPPVAEGLDALVHLMGGNKAPWANYVARCQAVKAEHPKPAPDAEG